MCWYHFYYCIFLGSIANQSQIVKLLDLWLRRLWNVDPKWISNPLWSVLMICKNNLTLKMFTWLNCLDVFVQVILGNLCVTSPSCLSYINHVSSLLLQQSRDHGLDVDPSIAGGPRSMYSSLSTLNRSQYPTLPIGASTSNGLWTPLYPTLARSTSAGGQSDSVFLDAPPDDPSLPPASPGRYSKDPTNPNGSQDDLETDGPNGFHHPHHLHHSLPRKSHGYNQVHALPGG